MPREREEAQEAAAELLSTARGDLLDVLGRVVNERIQQDAKWGEQDHHPLLWLAILGEEVGEAHQAALEAQIAWAQKNAARTVELHALLEYELVQVAAVAVAMACRLRRGEVGGPRGVAWSAPLVTFRQVRG